VENDERCADCEREDESASNLVEGGVDVFQGVVARAGDGAF